MGRALSRRVGVSRAGLALCALALVTQVSCAHAVDGEATEADRQPSSAVRQPSGAFEGVDPCSLVTSEEAREFSGAPVGKARRDLGPQLQSDPLGDSCSWDDTYLRIWFDVGEFEAREDSASTRLSGAVGRPANSASGDPGSCLAAISFTDDRVLTVSISPPTRTLANEPVDESNSVCDRSVPLLRDVITRVGWE
ncbi:DUF3558 domain-containing protein [Rhodococcus triatomae]|uniref:DUF3558 domain-containing protein n=1 Tax=Rhodococcus triatomae TaxID=300028 RepID=A0A1G8NJS2_9NOCA|nr:DUF3558 family protein [Rhodococcus triatomae]QNG20023.1 DUF3558 domain-containing protein [Rhodococcus triatomae]QNG24061.1 DUF3558 domain-containing protein [Rhodococcus triatomae]SDI80531.1 Protein of unknown function [Rhodococcus triatomae]